MPYSTTVPRLLAEWPGVKQTALACSHSLIVARQIFPTMPFRLKPEDRIATGGSLDGISVNHLSASTRATFRLAAHQIASCLEVLGLDIRSPLSSGNLGGAIGAAISGEDDGDEASGYALGHKHSALAVGETVMSILSKSIDLTAAPGARVDRSRRDGRGSSVSDPSSSSSGSASVEIARRHCS